MEELVMNVLGFIGTALSATLLAIFKKSFSSAQKRMEDMMKALKATQESNFVMLQDRILQSCRYHQSIGFIEPHDAEMLQKLADQYYAQGGNGYVKKQVEATLGLPQEIKEES